MLAMPIAIKNRLAALALFASWSLRTETDEEDPRAVPGIVIRGSGALATDSQTVAVTLEPSYTVTIAVKRSPDAAADLDAALKAVIAQLHNWRPGVLGSTPWQRVALQGIRPAEFAASGVAAYELIFSTTAVFHGHPNGATP